METTNFDYARKICTLCLGQTQTPDSDETKQIIKNLEDAFEIVYGKNIVKVVAIPFGMHLESVSR